MEPLKAVREDHDGLGLAGLFLPAAHFLAIVRWTSYACPYCGGVFRRDYWTHGVKLGTEERTCRECGKVFDTGSREWAELGVAAKLRLFFPPLLVGIWGGFVLAGIVSYFVLPRDEHSLFVVIFSCLVGLIPIILCSPYHAIEVFRSNRRYETRRMSKMSEIDRTS